MNDTTNLQGGELTTLTPLGRGGMGAVELARLRQGPVERLVAVKTLLGEHALDPSFRRMFETEARVMGRIRHANVVSVMGAGVSLAGPYFVMEYIEGVSLGQLLRSVAAEGERVPLVHVLSIIEQAALGLAAAHELTDDEGRPLSLIHRDVSPQNLLIGTDGVVRLTDFGIAKVSQSERTETGILKGKIGYMAPEQLNFDEPTAAADLFALGVVLFEATAGRRLYGGELRKAAKAILLEPPPDIVDTVPEVPDELAELLFELLAKDPQDRPASARDVADRLHRLRLESGEHESLAAYVGDRMASEIEELRVEVRRAQNRSRAKRLGPSDAAIETMPTTVSPFPAEPPSPLDGGTPSRPRTLGRGLALVGILAVAALAFVIGTAGEPEPEVEALVESEALGESDESADGVSPVGDPQATEGVGAEASTSRDPAGVDVAPRDPMPSDETATSGDVAPGDTAQADGQDSPAGAAQAGNAPRPRAPRREATAGRGQTNAQGLVGW